MAPGGSGILLDGLDKRLPCTLGRSLLYDVQTGNDHQGIPKRSPGGAFDRDVLGETDEYAVECRDLE